MKWDMFFQGAMFIVFPKCSRGYVYSRGYAYSGVQSNYCLALLIFLCKLFVFWFTPLATLTKNIQVESAISIQLHVYQDLHDYQAGKSKQKKKKLAAIVKEANNLFVTSKNETMNSPIHEFKVLHKGQRLLNPLFKVSFIILKSILSLCLKKALKDILQHFKFVNL